MQKLLTSFVTKSHRVMKYLYCKSAKLMCTSLQLKLNYVEKIIRNKVSERITCREQKIEGRAILSAVLMYEITSDRLIIFLVPKPQVKFLFFEVSKLNNGSRIPDASFRSYHVDSLKVRSRHPPNW